MSLEKRSVFVVYDRTGLTAKLRESLLTQFPQVRTVLPFVDSDDKLKDVAPTNK